MTVTGLTVPAGGNLMLVYEALPTAFAPPTADGSISEGRQNDTGSGKVTNDDLMIRKTYLIRGSEAGHGF